MALPLRQRIGFTVIVAFLTCAALTTASAQSLSLGGAACLQAATVPSNAGSSAWTPCSHGLFSVALTGARVGGTPARPLRDWAREIAALSRLGKQGLVTPGTDEGGSGT